MLRPTSNNIKIDETEIQAAKVQHLLNLLKRFHESRHDVQSAHAGSLEQQIFLEKKVWNIPCALGLFFQWMPLEEFVKQSFIQEDHMFQKIMDICIQRLRKCYCGLTAHNVISRFDGRRSTLYYNVSEPEDVNCNASWQRIAQPSVRFALWSSIRLCAMQCRVSSTATWVTACEAEILCKYQKKKIGFMAGRVALTGCCSFT